MISNLSPDVIEPEVFWFVMLGVAAFFFVAGLTVAFASSGVFKRRWYRCPECKHTWKS